MKNAFLLFTVILSFVARSASSKPLSIDLEKQESKVEFLAIGKPSLLKIKGTGGKAKGTLTSDSGLVRGEIIVALDKMTTGIDLRDEHMKSKYLDTSKFPEASLKIDDFKLATDPFATEIQLKNVPFTGKLKVHGEESSVSGSADISSDKSFVTVSAKTKTNISNHKIALPSYLGIKVADEVEISAELKIKK